MSRYTANDVLRVLNHTEWKRLAEILEGLIELKGIGNSLWDRLFRRPSYMWLGDTLDSLVQEGLVEEREGTDPGVLERRSGRRYPEYKLTEDGIRLKDKALEKEWAKRQPRTKSVPVLQPFHGARAHKARALLYDTKCRIGISGTTARASGIMEQELRPFSK